MSLLRENNYMYQPDDVVHGRSEVPLFRRQLPSCELPKLARDLKVKTWRQGRQGCQVGL